MSEIDRFDTLETGEVVDIRGARVFSVSPTWQPKDESVLDQQDFALEGGFGGVAPSALRGSTRVARGKPPDYLGDLGDGR